MKRRADGPAPIGDVLKKVFEKFEAEKNPSQEDVNALWKGLVGENGYKHSRPSSLRKKVLTVKVDHPGWMHELTFKKRILVKGLKRAMGKDRISEIHFKIGEF